MPELKFSCPECTQHIQCDTGYVGTQISCPTCKKPIVVPGGQPMAAAPVPARAPASPPAAPAAPAPAKAAAPVATKKSSPRKTLVIIASSALGVLVLLALAWWLFMGPKSVTVKAWVDGSDLIKLSGKDLWIEHQGFQKPDKITINGHKFDPQWDGNTSATYPLKRTFNPNPGSVKVKKSSGRGTVRVTDRPNAGNDYTATIRIDDNNQPGADWYEFVISW